MKEVYSEKRLTQQLGGLESNNIYLLPLPKRIKHRSGQVGNRRRMSCAASEERVSRVRAEWDES